MDDNRRHPVELADILMAHQDMFRHTLCSCQWRAYRAITSCRTARLGGHIQTCDTCGHSAQSYNSCRNRHCPRCQYVKKVQWVDRLAANLPAAKLFHLVFTIPTCLHPLTYANQRKAYDLLFKAAGDSLRACAKTTHFQGASLGAVAILHTWGQTLTYHPHIHMIVPAGALSEDATEWVWAHKRYLLPVKSLSRLFRHTLCSLLEERLADHTLSLPQNHTSFDSIKEACYKTNWVVYCEKPFKGPDNLIGYLGNYTHRVAISNQRIIAHENGSVRFWYKDYKCAGIRKEIALDAREFIRRFMQHILPDGFRKIRYFGFLALRHIKVCGQQCSSLIGKDTFLSQLEGLSAFEVLWHITGKDPALCPVCHHGVMRATKTLPAPG